MLGGDKDSHAVSGLQLYIELFLGALLTPRQSWDCQAVTGIFRWH